MEILSPTILDVVVQVVVALSVLSFLMLAGIVAIRWNTDRRQRRSSGFRKDVRPLVMDFIAGTCTKEDALEMLQADPKEALELLVETGNHQTGEGRNRVRILCSALPFEEEQLDLLESRHWETRRRAAERLGFVGGTASVGPLKTALADGILAVREAAARSLAAMGRIDAVESIVLALDVPGEMAERRAAEVLASMGEGVVDPLVAMLEQQGMKYSDTSMKIAIRTLGLLRSREAVPALLAFLKNKEFTIRLNSVRALGLIGDSSAIPEIAEMAEDLPWEVRNVAVQALGRLQAVERIPLLVGALGDPSWWVRFSAAQALYALGEPGLAALQKSMREHADRYARDISRQILQEHRLLESNSPASAI